MVCDLFPGCKCDKSSRTGKCLKPCPHGMKRNPITNRCVRDDPASLSAWVKISAPIRRKRIKNKKKILKEEDYSVFSLFDVEIIEKVDKKSIREIPVKTDSIRSVMSLFSVEKVTVPWFNVLKNWYHGRDIPLFSHEKNVYWETSRADSYGNSCFDDKIYPSENIKSDRDPYSIYREVMSMKGRRGKIHSDDHIVVFDIISDALLVFPPKDGRDFSHVGNFYKNATRSEIDEFWKRVSMEVRLSLSTGMFVYVSINDSNLNHFHVRIENKPVFYKTLGFIDLDDICVKID